MAQRGSAGVGFYGVRILVRDFARSWKFYRDTLGLRPARGHGEPPYGEFLIDGRPLVALFDRALMSGAVGLNAPAPRRGAVEGMAAIFEVADVDAFAGRLQRLRVPLIAGPTDRPEWQLRTLHLKDPDGNLVEINSRRDRRV